MIEGVSVIECSEECVDGYIYTLCSLVDCCRAIVSHALPVAPVMLLQGCANPAGKYSKAAGRNSCVVGVMVTVVGNVSTGVHFFCEAQHRHPVLSRTVKRCEWIRSHSCARKSSGRALRHAHSHACKCNFTIKISLFVRYQVHAHLHT